MFPSLTVHLAQLELCREAVLKLCQSRILFQGERDKQKANMSVGILKTRGGDVEIREQEGGCSVPGFNLQSVQYA